MLAVLQMWDAVVLQGGEQAGLVHLCSHADKDSLLDRDPTVLPEIFRFRDRTKPSCPDLTQEAIPPLQERIGWPGSASCETWGQQVSQVEWFPTEQADRCSQKNGYAASRAILLL
jgi:hypothetical protein